MENRCRVHSIFCAVCIAFGLTLTARSAAGAEHDRLLTGKTAMGDWTSDAPGVRRKITVEDLPAPSSNVLAINLPRVIGRPANAQLRVPTGFKIDLYAGGFRDPRFLLTAPNGDIFVTESRANQIKVLRDSKNTGKPETIETFAEQDLNKPFGIAFYPPGNDPQFLYVANTDGVIRFPYRNGDLKARGPAEKLGAHLSGGGLVRGGGHWTRCIVFSPDGKKMYVSIGSRSNVSDSASEESRARIFEFNPDRHRAKGLRLGNSQGCRHRVSARHKRALDEHKRAGRDRRRFAARLHQQRASRRILRLAVVLHRKSSGSAPQGKTSRARRQSHRPRCARAGALGFAQPMFLYRRPISVRIQRRHLRHVPRFMEPHETYWLQSRARTIRQINRESARRI